MNFQICQRIFFSFHPVYSNWVNCIKKVSIQNCSRSSKSLKSIYFFLETSKVDIFFIWLLAFLDSFPTVCWLFFNFRRNLRHFILLKRYIRSESYPEMEAVFVRLHFFRILFFELFKLSNLFKKSFNNKR